MRIVLLHAYSSRNAGDGLLVDESVALLLRLGVRRKDIHLVALDPNSFRDTPLPVTGVLGAADPFAEFYQLRRAGAALRGLLGLGPVRRLIEEADAVVAVGGGYLRSRTCWEGFTTLLAHGSQLRFAARSKSVTVYLPQSIGPLNGPIGALLRRWLQDLGHVAVRDDRSLREVPQAKRVPDLGLLRLARHAPEPQSGDGSVVLVARRLPAPRRYEHNLQAFTENLAASGRTVRMALQSSAGTRNDDRGFALSLGLREPSVTLKERLASPAEVPSLVVSVRLHGCVQALMAGVPTIHLSYERKSIAAFEDLGLSEFVHHARTFSPEGLAMQCRKLLRDPRDYWDRVAAALPGLGERGAAYERYVAQALGIAPTQPAGFTAMARHVS
ncbi:polysaccharide pyruvyl transferase family protein [Streptomyces mirabilis]|uniref:polysaccharide pyruvyl transferase family protein n=1 Tax=Streptomyces mirabilis TaxID=68239 RepID=UPI0033C5341B